MQHGSKILAEPRRVLAVARNLAVLEFLAGGTLRLLRLAGSHVTVVVSERPDGSSTGSAQEDTRQMQPREPAAWTASIRDTDRRARNATTRCIRSISEKEDCRTKHHWSASLRTVWEEVRPDLVFTLDPAFPLLFFSRPRHTVVGKAVVTLSRALGDSGTIKRPEVLFCGTREANVMIDMGRSDR